MESAENAEELTAHRLPIRNDHIHSSHHAPCCLYLQLHNTETTCRHFVQSFFPHLQLPNWLSAQEKNWQPLRLHVKNILIELFGFPLRDRHNFIDDLPCWGHWACCLLICMCSCISESISTASHTIPKLCCCIRLCSQQSSSYTLSWLTMCTPKCHSAHEGMPFAWIAIATITAISPNLHHLHGHALTSSAHSLIIH